MYKILCTFFFVTLIFSNSNAQETKDALSRLEKGEDLNVIYRNEASFGVFLHSAGGIGIAGRKGKQVNVDRKRMWELELQNFKHPKEVKTVNSYYESAQGYVYGKLNSVLLSRGGFGYQNILFQKSNKKNVEVRYSTFIGGTVAFEKPIYLEIRSGQAFELPKTERYDPSIHKQEDIYGKAPFFKGIDKTKLVPGAYAKLALSVEYADRYNEIKAVETGLVADVYPKALDLMAYTKKQNIYLSLYIKMIWGKKWF